VTPTLSTEPQPEVEDHQASLSSPLKRHLNRRSFLALAAASVGGFAVYAGEVSRHELTVEEHTIQLSRLPDAFRGMRIVQVSDFHYAEYTEPYFIREMVQKINHLRPDMVVLIGDYISYGPAPKAFARRCVPHCAAILSAIECPLRYATLGNHDYYAGPHFVTGTLRDHGLPVLLNSAIALERDGQRVWLAGLGSACEHGADPARAIPRAVAKEPVILLAHEPDILPDIARYNVDLMLSGHTHGGQIRLPFVPEFYLPIYGRKYVMGRFRYGPTQLYVNRGIGAIGVPFRFRCPPEITVITLA
jgi:hypothetical protein